MAHSLKQPSWDNVPDSPPPPKRDLRVVPKPEKEMFRSLEPKGSRQRAVIVSTGVHIVILTVLILIPLLFTDSLKFKSQSYVILVPPQPKPEVLEVTHWKLEAPPKPKPADRVIAPPPRIPEVTDKFEPPKPEAVPEPEIKEVKVTPKPLEAFNSAAAEAPRPVAPKPEVKTDVFDGSSGSSAKATVNLPAREVQTGGFGDPNGARGEGRPDKVTNIASLGAFDLPTGPGAGNGSGGAKGVKGVVSSAGFGNGIATGSGPAGNGGSGKGTVSQGGFGDAKAGAATQQRQKLDVPAQTPVEITFKPRPDYTPEARDKRLEGEVLLKVLFTASGQIQVLDLVKGLGFGLDESARRAAQQIRFTPAKRDGQPVDSTATVHIVFQLAY